MVEGGAGLRNDAVAWADFDADEYWKLNFATVLPEDTEIIKYATKFLVTACETPGRFETAMDVGAGPNLYPGLLMLPWAKRLVFAEDAEPNIDWLKKHLVEASGTLAWQPFWDLIADQPGYPAVEAH